MLGPSAVECQSATVAALVLSHATVRLIPPVWVGAVHVEQASIRHSQLGHLQRAIHSGSADPQR